MNEETLVNQEKSEVVHMSRLIYWIKKCMNKNNKFCRHFCVTCEFYVPLDVLMITNLA